MVVVVVAVFLRAIYVFSLPQDSPAALHGLAVVEEEELVSWEGAGDPLPLQQHQWGVRGAGVQVWHWLLTALCWPILEVGTPALADH